MFFTMDVSDAVARRVSIRAFKPDPVPRAQVAGLLEAAGRAPSGGNLAPWRVYALTGKPLAELKAAAAANPMGEAMDYDIYPPSLWDPYRRRRFEGGEALYETLGIPRQDRVARLTQLMRNGQLFGAPVGVFVCIDRKLGPPQWSDLGMYIQTFLLLAQEQGARDLRAGILGALSQDAGAAAGPARRDDGVLRRGSGLGRREPPDKQPAHQPRSGRRLADDDGVRRRGLSPNGARRGRTQASP